MKKLSLFILMAVSITACQKSTTSLTSNSGEVQAVWSSSAPQANWANGGYTLYNDVWGSNPGSQNIWANSYSNWGIWANHQGGHGVESYPHTAKYVNMTLDNLSTCKSSFTSTVPTAGAWEIAHDIWDSQSKYETMLWMDYQNVKPISYHYDANGNAIPVFTNVNLGGHVWNVYQGNNGSNDVFSFVRTSNTNNGTVDILAILNWCRSSPRYWFGNFTLGNVDNGFEISDCYNGGSGENFTMNSFSVTYN